MSVTFHLQGQKCHGLNGGPAYAFTPAVSMFVSVETQADVDELWTALTAGRRSMLPRFNGRSTTPKPATAPGIYFSRPAGRLAVMNSVFAPS
jgi:hypothetical protein